MRAPEDEPSRLDWGPEDEPGSSPDTYYDPLEVLDLPEEDRWPASPRYRRYCTRAETRALEDWVRRQMIPQASEHDRFFTCLDRHGPDDEPDALFAQAA